MVMPEFKVGDVVICFPRNHYANDLSGFKGIKIGGVYRVRYTPGPTTCYVEGSEIGWNNDRFELLCNVTKLERALYGLDT